MSAVYTLPSLAEATEHAEKWLDTARPIILAMFALEDVTDGLRRRAYDTELTSDERTFREAAGYTGAARLNLYQMLDDIRDAFLADETPRQPPSDDEDAWGDHIEFCDALNEAVADVAGAIDAIIREQDNANASR